MRDNFRKSDNFVDDGLLESLDIVELIDKLLEEYGIEILPEDIDSENFQNAEKIWGMVKKYR